MVLIQGGGIAGNPGDLTPDGIALDTGLATAARIAAERKAGREVYVWTLDDEESWQLMTARDADRPDHRHPGPGPPLGGHRLPYRARVGPRGPQGVSDNSCRARIV
ncbi:hypothetical protein ACWC9T_11710 [Kitasatospora sp. NPDC001159]